MATNLCTNPSFEYGTTGWAANDSAGIVPAGASLAQIGTDNAPSAGTHCLQVSTTVATGNEGVCIAALPGPGGGNWLAGTTYDFSLYIKSVSGSTSLQIGFGPDAAGFASSNITITGAWARYDLTWIPAANVATALIFVRNLAAQVQVFNIDAVMVIQGSAPISYFDGDTTGFQWNGTPGNSTSSTIIILPQRTFYDRPRLQVLIDQKDLTERCDSLVFSATDAGGFEIATLGLPAADRPKKGAQVWIRQGLETAWLGRTAEIADHSQHGRATRTTGCEGAVAALHDNPMQMIYVDRDLTQWSDPSTSRQISLIGTNKSLASSTPAPDTASGLPSVVQEIDDSWVPPYLPLCEAWYDGGAGNLLAAIYYNLLASGPVLATTDEVLLSSDDIATLFENSANLYTTVGASGYFAPGTPYRYGMLQKAYATTPAGAQGARYLTTWRNIAVYGNHGLTRRGADPGGFYPSDIARHALSQVSGVTPGTIVDSTGYIAPHVVYRTPVDPATIIDDMAKLMGWTWGVWEPSTILGSQPRLDFRPSPSDATAIVTKADCDQLDITSRLGDLYDIAEITYTDVAGKLGISTVKLANPQMVEAGIAHRTLQLNMGLGSAAAATAFGLFALALSQISARAAGQATLPVAVRLPGGGSKPAVLLRPGIDRLRIVDLIDGGPMFDLGNVRRDVFRISRVETTVGKDGTPSTRAELDTGTNLLERLQARLALADGVVGAGASGG